MLLILWDCFHIFNDLKSYQNLSYIKIEENGIYKGACTNNVLGRGSAKSDGLEILLLLYFVREMEKRGGGQKFLKICLFVGRLPNYIAQQYN